MNRKRMKNQKTEGKRLSLQQEIYNAGLFPNLVTGAISIVYIAATSHIRLNSMLPVILIGLLICVLLQFVVAPVTNKFITQAISDDLDSFYNYGSDTKERTKLMKGLMAIPEKIGVEVFAVFMIGIVVWVCICNAAFHLEFETLLMFLFSGFFGAYAGLVLGVEQTQKVCSLHTTRIVEKGVLREEVEEKHCFGTSSTKITIIHIFGPLALINIFFMVIAWRSAIGDLNASAIILRSVVVTIFNIVFYVIFSSMLFLRMMKSINSIKFIMESMDRENLESVENTPTDLSNEFMYNIYLINSIISILQNVLQLSHRVSNEVIGSSNDLSVISKETSATSLEQTAAIKELLVAMEESDKLAKDISDKISGVSRIACQTSEDVEKGYGILNEEICAKLEEIKDANRETVEGIQSLSERISGISDIATIINSIADQTNIIAFNAELEASSAGEAGTKFLNVANEIRRLTNNTIQSTNEIQSKIFEIQQASLNLLADSRKGSEAISTGYSMVEELNEGFQQLKETSTIVTESADEVKNIVMEQTSSFEQIVVTLNQIGAAAENFSASTQHISSSAENLCAVSEKLKELQPSSNQSEETEAVVNESNEKGEE